MPADRLRGPVAALSPHFDDCAMSCVSALSGPGSVLVTVFGGPPPVGAELSAWDGICGGASPAALFEERREENRRAAEILGVPAVDFELADGQYRTGAAGVLAEVCALLTALVERRGIATLVVPAGIGGHPDHLVVRAAAEQVGVDLVAYADTPYALLYGWPAWVSGSASVCVEEDWAQFMDRGAAWGAGAETVRLSDAETTAKLRACKAYASQFTALDARFGGRLSDPEVMCHEVYWRPS